MSEPFIGEIRMFTYSFAPRNWAFCDGQLLPVSQNTSLFSIIGTSYGGDGRTNFALPDLKGRTPMQAGRGAGLTSRRLGEAGGSPSITLTESQIPGHTHNFVATKNNASSTDPVSLYPAKHVDDAKGRVYKDSPSALDAQFSPAVLSSNGNQPHENRQPNLVVTFCIALDGLYPSRS